MTLYGVFGSNELDQALELAKMVADYYDEFRKLTEGRRVSLRQSVIALDNEA